MVAKSTIQAGELDLYAVNPPFWTCTEQRAMAILSPSSSRSIWSTQHDATQCEIRAPPTPRWPLPTLRDGHPGAGLRRGYRLARQRQLTRALLDLEAAELKDIGLSAEAREEASLAFWQAGRSGGRKA